MDKIGTARGDTPAFNLLEPAQRVVMGCIAAIGVVAAGYFIFVPLSDASAIQLSRRQDAGSSGYAAGQERLAQAGRRNVEHMKTARLAPATAPMRTAGAAPDTSAPMPEAEAAAPI